MENNNNSKFYCPRTYSQQQQNDHTDDAERSVADADLFEVHGQLIPKSQERAGFYVDAEQIFQLWRGYHDGGGGREARGYGSGYEVD